MAKSEDRHNPSCMLDKKNNSTLSCIGHLTPHVLKCLTVKMLRDFDLNFANVDNLYFSLPRPYAHGIMPLEGLKEIESTLGWGIP